MDNANSYEPEELDHPGQSSELNNQRRGGYLGSVHMLRGIAALLVVFDHVLGRPPFRQFNHWFGFLDDRGSFGVVTFFCISGLVLFLALSKGYSIAKFPRFMLRRILRIVPTYLTSIILAVVLVFLMSKAAPNGAVILPSWSQLFQHILYLIPFTGETWIQPIYWTLAVEFQFYLTIGIFFPLVAAVAKTQLHAAMALIVSFSLLTFLDPSLPEAKLFKYSPFFAVGMLHAAGMVHRSARGVTLLGTLACMTIGLAGGLNVASVVVGGAIGVIFLLSPRKVDKESPWVRPFWYLGTISYSLYVVHQVIASAGENAGRLLLRMFPGTEGGIILNLIPVATFFLCILLAHGMHHLVEVPSMRWSRRIRSGLSVVSGPYCYNIIRGQKWTLYMRQIFRRLFRRTFSPVSYDPFAYWNERKQPNTTKNPGVSANEVYFFEKHVPAGQKILEVGPGIGRLFELYRGAREGKVATLDLARQHFEAVNDAAKRQGLAVEQSFIDRVDAPYPFGYQAFDIAVSSYVLIHVPFKNIRFAMTEMARVASRVIVFTSISPSWAQNEDEVLPSTHVFGHNYDEICTELGLTIHDRAEFPSKGEEIPIAFIYSL